VGAVAAAANVEPHLAQEALTEENDANAAVSMLLKRQEKVE
jgi:predicted metal-binding transcription factor (methanogenesis marker protein 9)